MENDKRTAEFRRNLKLEQVLIELNGLLAGCQATVNEKYEKLRYPILLLMGVPRSGTTLFMQWLAESGCWGYTTNLISRFYAAPYIGARLQQALIENDFRGELTDFKKPVPYESTLGKTRGALSPHEFFFFWGRFFTLGKDAHIVSPENLAKVDTAKFVRELASLEAALEKPLAMKAMYLNWHIPFLDGLFERALFIHMKRDPAYVVQSLLESRQKFFGSEEMWYSVKPPEYEWLKDREPVEQVAGQVYYTCKATETGMAQVAEERQLTVDYEQFCAAPAEVWNAIRTKMAAQGHALDAEYKGPARFETGNTARMPAERWQALQEAIVAIQQADMKHEPLKSKS
jgi:hypothetical protein